MLQLLLELGQLLELALQGLELGPVLGLQQLELQLLVPVFQALVLQLLLELELELELGQRLGQDLLE